MNKTKTYYIWLHSALLLLCAVPAIIRAQDFDQEVDIFDFLDQPENEALIDAFNFDTTRICNKATALDTLQALDADKLLQTDFFLRSNPIQTRSLLDYPEFLPWRHEKDRRAFGFDLFYNQTTRGYFTHKSSNICSYLAIEEDSPFIQALGKIFQNVQNLGLELPITIDEVSTILKLFETFTVQERRLGFMFHAKGSIDKWNLYMYAPWYYLERNHFINPTIQAEIEELIEDIFGESTVPECEEIAFQDAHFVSDSFGIGDTRLMVDYPVYDTTFWQMYIGGLATIPTAFAFKKGLKGNHFHRLTCRPLLPLCDLVNNIIESRDAGSNNDLEPFLLSLLDNASAMLIQTPLGNGSHPGIGIYMRNTVPVSEYIQERWARKLLLRSFISLEYLIPGWEKRSFRFPANRAPFAQFPLENISADRVDATYDFIVQQLTDRFIPIGLETKVHPGIIFHSSTQVSYEGKRNGFTFGTDTWVRSPEHLKKIQGCKELLAQIDQCNAAQRFGYQSKLFGSIFFKVKKPGRLWTFTLGGDTTFMTRGIGQDYSLLFGIDVIF